MAKMRMRIKSEISVEPGGIQQIWDYIQDVIDDEQKHWLECGQPADHHYIALVALQDILWAAKYDILTNK